MSRPRLKTVSRTQGNNAALKDGTVVPTGFVLDFVEVPVLVRGNFHASDTVTIRFL